MPERVVGVSFDDDAIYGAECHRSGRRGEAHVVRRGVVVLDPGVVVRGELVDIAAAAAGLRRLWSEAGFTTSRVAIGLDVRSATLRRVELPTMDRADLDSAARYEVAELLSYPVDEALVSSVDLGTDEADRTRLLTLAVRDRILSGFAEVAEAAGLRFVSTHLIQAALATSRGAGTTPPGSLGLVVNAGRTRTDLVVHDGDGIVFGRSLAAGVGDTATSLFDELEFELAALHSVSGGAQPAESAAPTGSVSLLSVVEGIANTLSYFAGEISSAPIARISLSGDDHGVEPLAEALAEAHPTATLVIEERGPDAPHEGAAGFTEAVAVGQVALGHAPTNWRSFDLTPPAVHRRRAHRRMVWAGLGLAILAAPILVNDALDRRSVARERATQAETIELELAALRDRADDTLALRDAAASADRAEQRYDALAARELGLTTVIRQVAETLPEDAYLLSLQLRRAGPGEQPPGYQGTAPVAIVSISGVARDLGQVGSWLVVLDAASALEQPWLANVASSAFEDSQADGVLFTVEAGLAAGAVAPPSLPMTTEPGS
ncbi:MAG: pilus assembly protein PilM [Acidimicrobiales bacterium]